MGPGGDDPPFLCVGTDVSAKYRGAFCEAKVKKIVKVVKCKVFLKETQSSLVVADDCVKGILKVNATVDVKLPDTGQIVEGIINKLTDASMYTVVFDDGDEKTLRRTQLCLKGEKHFMESETLDNLPLSHPEHFGTPVMSNKKGKRGKYSNGNDEDDEDDSSSDESIPKRAEYKGRLQGLVGKVMIMEQGEKRKLQVPVLVVLPDAHSTELRTKDHMLLKSFKDGKFFAVPRKDLKDFSKEIAHKNDEKILKAAMDKALAYYDNQDLPASWERDELLGTDEEDDSYDDESSDDEPSEEKDLFVAQLYKFMDDRGTPINKGPSLASKDLNLYRLFKIVRNIGGYNRVTNQMKWKVVYAKMKMQLTPCNTAAHQIKNAYKKYLHAFEDFYRKLGSTMGTISRPVRGRNNSGRNMVAFKKETSSKKDSDDKSDEDEEDEEMTESPAKRDKSPPKRVSRQEQAVVAASLKEKEEKMKEEKTEDLPKKITKTPAKKEDIIKKPMPKVVKKEKEVVKNEGNEEKAADSQTKKVIRRRSVRKEDDGKNDGMEEKEEESPRKLPASESKTKVKMAVSASKEDKKDKKLVDDKKEDIKKLTRKEFKKVTKSDDEEDADKSKVKKVVKKKVDGDCVAEKGREKTVIKKECKKELPVESEGKNQDNKSGSNKKESRPAKSVEKGKTTEKGPLKTDKITEKGPLKTDKNAVKSGEKNSGKDKSTHKGGEKTVKTEEDDEEEEDAETPVSFVSSDTEHPCGTKLQVRYGRGRNQKVYDAKIVEAGKEGSHQQYLVHYAGWNMRYDEWIRPERIVKVVHRPDPDKVRKAIKEGAASPSSTSGSSKSPSANIQLLKKRGRPGPSSTPSPKSASMEAKPVISTEARPTPNQPVVKITKSPVSSTKIKSRQTRSNSTELRVTDVLPVKQRRTRRSSGLTESSDINSQGSDSDSDKSDVETDDMEPALMIDSPEPAELDNNMSLESNNDTDERDSNSSSPEMPNLERKIPIEEEEECVKPLVDAEEVIKVDTTEEDQVSQQSVNVPPTDSVAEDKKPVLETFIESTLTAPKLEVAAPVEVMTDKCDKAEDNKEDAAVDNKKEEFKWDVEEEDNGKAAPTADVLENTETVKIPDSSEVCEQHLQSSAPILEKQSDNKEEVNQNIDKPAPEIHPEVLKCDSLHSASTKSALIDDRFEFHDDEEEITLPDLRAETEKELKERQKAEALEAEKRVTKKKEKKEVKKGKMTMAERKMMVIVPEEFTEAGFCEPPIKKLKEEKCASDSEKTHNVVQEMKHSTIDDVISSVCDQAREFAAEENEVEKKRVKKKVKKKVDSGETGDVKKESKKDTVKNVKNVKLDKCAIKGKAKKSKETIEADGEPSALDTCAITSTECKHDSEINPILSPSSEPSNKTVIKSALVENQQPLVLSGMQFLSDVALMSERESVRTEAPANTVLDNTPPTTPEHDGIDNAHHEHSSLSSNESELKVSSEIHTAATSHEHHYGVGESLAGNTSPSSNDGSVGSGNVACSESSNGEVSVTPSHHNKRRRESEENTPSKKKRKSKSKTAVERKSSRLLTVGSDSDETSEKKFHSDSSSVVKSSNYIRPPKYNLNLDEGKYLEGEKRIEFLTDKIQEIRKIYMQLKSEVACIDRRRKRARRKERERDSVHSSSTAAEVETGR